MSKYKAGDIIEWEPRVLTEYEAESLNKGWHIQYAQSPSHIFKHIPAPEPIVRYVLIPKKETYGFKSMEDAIRIAGNIGDYNVVKTINIGNDFTVEKCDE